MLDVCYEYAQSHDISLNCSKTKIMMFKTKFLKLNFVLKLQLGNCVIDYLEKVKYLGFLLGSGYFAIDGNLPLESILP